MTPRIHTLFGVAATAIVAATIAWGFFLVGSPVNRRSQRIDEDRLRDLQTIAREIRSLVVNRSDLRELKQPLPQTLEEAAKRAKNQRLNLKDPETGEPYEYRVTGPETYELCATFTHARSFSHSVFWNHPAGKHCYKIDVFDSPMY